MEINLGENNRLFRILAGIVLIASGLTFFIVLVPVGLYFVITSAFGYDPVIGLLGLKTTKEN